MTPSQLKAEVETAGHDPHFFTSSSMRFFGDRMRNYGVRAQPVTLVIYTGERRKCWELYRRRPVKHGLTSSAFFDCETFARRHGEIINP